MPSRLLGPRPALRGRLAEPWTFIAPWYVAYLILGLVVSGLLPFLLPLMVSQAAPQPSKVAYVIGAYNLGLLVAPLLGELAERCRLYRSLFFGGFVAMGCALALLPVTSGLIAWISLSLVIGVGAAASTTVATLFIVDFAPQQEWDRRIGWLQSFNGAGQVGGLLLAGVFGGAHIAEGLWVAAAFNAAALLVGWIGLPSGPATHAPARSLDHRPLCGLVGAASLDPMAGGLLAHLPHLYRAALCRWPEIIGTRFAKFLSSWFAYNFGMAAFFAY